MDQARLRRGLLGGPLSSNRSIEVAGAPGICGDARGLSCRCNPVHSESILQALLKAGAFVSGRGSNGRTPLHLAAKYNSLKCAKILMDNGSKVNPKDDKGVTPLDLVESKEMISLLKDYGAKE